MKKIYSVWTVQFFSYTIYQGIFRKNKEPKVKSCWVLRNRKFIYAENEKAAEEKYSAWFKKTYIGVTRGWETGICGQMELATTWTRIVLKFF